MFTCGSLVRGLQDFSVLSAPCPWLHTIGASWTFPTTFPDFPSCTSFVTNGTIAIRLPVSVSPANLLVRLGSLPSLSELRTQSANIRLDDELSSPGLADFPSLSSLACNLLDSTALSLLLESTSLPNIWQLRVQMDHSSGDGNLQWL